MNHTRRVRAPSLVLAFLGAASVALAGGDPVAIALKPTTGPVEYWIRTVETTTRTGPGVLAPERVADSLELASQTVTAGQGNLLEVRVQTGGRSLRIDGTPVDQQTPEKKFSYRMTSRGVRPDVKPDEGLTPFLSPALPEGAVPPGHTWTATIPSTKRFPKEITLTHRFEGVSPFQGTPCAVITSRASETLSDKDLACELTLVGKTQVSVAGGVILRSESLTIVKTTAAKAFKDGSKVLRQRVRRIVERRVPGKGEPPVR